MVAWAKEPFSLVTHVSFFDLAPVLFPDVDLTGSFLLSIVLVADRRESARARGGVCPTGIAPVGMKLGAK